MFIVNDIFWWNIVASMKESSNAISVSRGSNNKRHLSSKIDTRLISYMLAIFNLDMHMLNTLNAFDIVEKEVILPFMDYFNKKEIRITKSNTPVMTFPTKHAKYN